MFGEYDWHYTVAIGLVDDTRPENRTAREERDRIREHLPHLSREQLRDYLNGLHTGIDMYTAMGL